jgi:acyl-CoA thioester hydrolase
MRRSWQTKGRDGAAVQRNISHKHELLADDIVEVRRRVLELREKALRFAHDIGNVLRRKLAG